MKVIIKTEPTHAGGVVVRKAKGNVEYLIIRSKNLNSWVLPKGHIKKGESHEDTAKREVMEETGILADIICDLDTIAFDLPKERVFSRFFLMEFIRGGLPHENREAKWCSYLEAIGHISFIDAQRLIHTAEIRLKTDRSK